MKKRIFLLTALLVLIVSPVVAEVTYHAVICGISDYFGTSNDLNYCDDDAYDMQDALMSYENWSSSNIILLIDSSATKSAVQSAIQTMASNADSNDVCLFFYSGHGTTGSDVSPLDESDGYDEYLVTYNFLNISDDELGDWIAALPTDNYAIFIDTCYSGGNIKDLNDGVKIKGIGSVQPAPGDGFAADFAGMGSTKDLNDNGCGVVLTACDDDEYSTETSVLENGVFTYYLVEGIHGLTADTSGNNRISAEECYTYTNPRATSYNSEQHAQIYDAYSGDLDFTGTDEPTPPVAANSVAAVSPNTPTDIYLEAIDEGEPDPPAMLSYIITSLPDNGSLSDPNGGEIVSVPYTIIGNGNHVVYSPDSGYFGDDSFDFKANDDGTAPDGGDSNIATVSIDVANRITVTIGTGTATWQYPMHTFWHDSRTQVIYLASEIGFSGVISDLALDVETVPGQTLNNWTIRMKHTSLDSYISASLDATGWVVVYQGNEPAGATGWRNFVLSTGFDYNGTDNLLVDFSHNNAIYTTDGMCRCSAAGTSRSVYGYTDSNYGDPLTWSGATAPTVYTSTNVPNVKLTICGGGEFVLDPPILHSEPNATAGMSNMISWDPVVNAGQYYADCAIDANFNNVIASSGWVSETDYEFYNLIAQQKYWYSVKARTDCADVWSQTEQSEFNTDALTHVSTTTVNGDVVLMGGGGSILFQDGFEDGSIADWTVGSGIYTREVTAATAAAGSTYSLTLTGGAGDHYDGVSHALNSITPDSITFYVRSDSTASVDGYFVVGSGPSSGETAVFFFMNGGEEGMVIYDGANFWGISYASLTWYKIRFDFDWAAKEIDYYVNDSLVKSDITFRATSVSSLTNLYLYNFDNSQAWWDEIEFSDSSGGTSEYALAGDIISTTIDLPVGGSWGKVSFNTTVPVETCLTVDVLDASDDSVILSNIACGEDLSGIGATSIKLRGNLSTSDTDVTPALHDWSVTYFDLAGAIESEWSNVESSQQAVLGDFEPDGDVDVDDLATMGESWLDTTGSVEADINLDNTVDFADYAIFSGNWTGYDN